MPPMNFMQSMHAKHVTEAETLQQSPTVVGTGTPKAA